ncbi:amino acid ABC transporter ATP-binding protein [Nocardioides salarius]|uniref:amino acid ABC transporter ATP-binding protein n=1 Tax=Nocardioides salarius TaxID=374513 RepID=UPI0030F5DA69
MSPLVEVTGLRKTYGDRVVLDDVDLRVEPGDVVCLIGSSGSGKSTLLRCLNLLEDIDDGVIAFEGREISDPRIDPMQVRRRIGMVFQAYNLFPHLTVLENCTLAPRHAHGLGRRAARERARELLERFGLAEHADKHPDRLSGGQQQRAAVVRALCTQPTLLLLDEVTAALDPELVGDVLGIVRDLAAAGTTMVLATHEMAFAREVATKVAFLDGGRILEQGPPAQIFAEPREERTRAFLRRVLDPGTNGPDRPFA